MSSIPATHEIAVPRQWAHVLGWGVYVGCSWTWCIGMFLPVLLVRDFGVWGFAVFAIPNVIGAMAMGWLLRKAATQEWVREHGGALTWFLRVTLVFEWFFLGWVSASVHAWWLGMAVLVVGGLWPQPEGRGWRGISIATWLISIGCAVAYLLTAPASAGLEKLATAPSRELIWLAPTCIFGFALCPYLDVTFHNARRQLNAAESRAAFTLGFGLFFFAMIVFTLAYTPLMLTSGPAGLAAAGAIGVAGIAIVVHFAVRIGFTTFAFIDAFDRMRPRTRMGLAGVDLVVLLVIAYLGGFLSTGRQLHGYEATELVYRGFMAFYGLVFPAYVWICVIPRKRGEISTPRGTMTAFWIAVLAAAPCYWLGFIERRTEWLCIGLGVVLLARLLRRKGGV